MAVFVTAFVALALAERLAPRRSGAGSLRVRRWFGNLAMLAVGTLLVRAVAPAAVVGAALWAEARGYGLFAAVGAPVWLAGAISFIALDLLVWAQHVAMHRVPLLWRLHRVHHADLEVDLTTGLRFHPLELLLSLLVKAAGAVALGAPPLAVLVFELVLNASSMFGHSNLRLAQPLDRALRRLLVTPDMHRVHHSWLREETDANYGFNLSCWDRWFGTYRAQPASDHVAMTLGLPAFRDAHELGLGRMLLQPFR